MTKYDEAPEAGEADLRKASDEVGKADDALDDALERVEQAERDVDAAYAAKNTDEQAAAEQRTQDIELEIEGLRQDLATAEDHLEKTQEYWLE